MRIIKALSASRTKAGQVCYEPTARKTGGFLSSHFLSFDINILRARQPPGPTSASLPRVLGLQRKPREREAQRCLLRRNNVLCLCSRSLPCGSEEGLYAFYLHPRSCDWQTCQPVSRVKISASSQLLTLFCHLFGSSFHLKLGELL